MKLSRKRTSVCAHCAECAPVRSACAGIHGTVAAMNKTRDLARIILAAEHRPEPARSTAVAELWAVRRFSQAGQADAVRRWHAAMETWVLCVPTGAQNARSAVRHGTA